MKEYLIKLLIDCDELNHDVATHKSVSPSSSVEEIAEYVSKNISSDFFVTIMNEILGRLFVALDCCEN